MNVAVALPARRRLARAIEWTRAEPRLADGVAMAAIGLAVRLAVVAWAADRFPAAADGHYYDVVARRIARGLGYTWEWPDGAVTFAAHYPVGYPALVGAAYRLAGPHLGVAMIANAVLGALSVLAVHRVAAVAANRGGALLAAVALALHPGLVFYTPALMTEGAASALLALAAWAMVVARTRASRRALAAEAIVLGVSTLVRPQSLLLAPFQGALSTAGAFRAFRRRVAVAALVTAGALAVCLPWTLRNCSRMGACVVVSANAGWNLFIGAAERATGAWVSIDELGVPVACRTVWGEADKDACFGREGRLAIRRAPLRWLTLVPKKLSATFDYAGAAGWYLHESNPAAFDDRDKLALGVAETVWQRVILLLGLASLARAEGPRRRARTVGAAGAAVLLFTKSGWLAHVGLVGVALLLGKRLPDRPVAGLAAATVFSTAITHAVFFGAGRYSLVCFPALSALAGTVLTEVNGAVDNRSSKES